MTFFKNIKELFLLIGDKIPCFLAFSCKIQNGFGLGLNTAIVRSRTKHGGYEFWNKYSKIELKFFQD